MLSEDSFSDRVSKRTITVIRPRETPLSDDLENGKDDVFNRYYICEKVELIEKEEEVVEEKPKLQSKCLDAFLALRKTVEDFLTGTPSNSNVLESKATN